MIKRLVIKRIGLPTSTNVSEIRIFFRGNELPNHRSLLACPTDREWGRIRLQWAFRDTGVKTGVGVRELGIRPPPQLETIINEINLALQRGMNPRLTLDGTGGTYILTNTKKQCIAMFKPSNEEAFAPNNPRGYEGKMGQKGFRSGVRLRTLDCFFRSSIHIFFCLGKSFNDRFYLVKVPSVRWLHFSSMRNMVA